MVNMTFNSARLIVGVDDLRSLFQQYKFHDPIGYSCERWERKLNSLVRKVPPCSNVPKRNSLVQNVPLC